MPAKKMAARMSDTTIGFLLLPDPASILPDSRAEFLTAPHRRAHSPGMDGGAKNPNWIRAIDLAVLERSGRAVVRHEGRQIALFATAEGIRACNNRCPHESYPLSEGTL